MVFLCHSSQDKPVVRTLYRRLCDENIDPWLDEEKLLPGENWDLEIKKAVRGSDVVVVCLSDQSVRKEGYIQREIKYALDIAEEKPEGTIFIIPIKLNECIVPSSLSKYQWVNYLAENAYEKLLRSLRKRAEHLKESGQELILPKAVILSSDDLKFTSPSVEVKARLVVSPVLQKRMLYETLGDLEQYLDTGDLRKLTFTSLGVLKDDILEIISWLKVMRMSGYEYGTMRSIDETLANLMLVRDSLQVAQGLFKQERLLDDRDIKRFYAELRRARYSASKALELFSSNL